MTSSMLRVEYSSCIGTVAAVAAWWPSIARNGTTPDPPATS